jgi:endonuclease/exonuclease/phosphatase (EEP) superfamily protein YafD
MRIRVFVLTALLGCGAGFAQDSAETARPIGVSFWNIQWFPGRRPNATRAEQVRQINAVHRDVAQLTADVIGLEEVRDWNHAALAIKPLPGFKVDVCSTFPPREGQRDTQQVAITSRRQPMCAWSEMWQPGGPLTPPRGFAFAAYEIAPRRLLLVYALHLKSNGGDTREDIRLREESMRQLSRHIEAMASAFGKLGALSFVVGGDFNTAPDDPRFSSEQTVPMLSARGFRWCWQGIPFDQRITLPSDARFPAACFDQIFYRQARLLRAWVTPTSPLSSDHRAINATLLIR